MMVSGTNYTKLKTNLRLAMQRLKMAEAKKTELGQKARREIGEYLSTGKYERARIRVEHIIREDYLVEAMEIVEMYCDLLLTRFSMIQTMKTLDEGLAEAISSMLWVAPRLQNDVAELRVVSDLLTQKYGKQYAQAARDNSLNSVSEKLMHKMSIESPPKILVENYLIEIAKTLNIEYEPDASVMKNQVMDAIESLDSHLIDFGELAQPIGPPPMPPLFAPNEPRKGSMDANIVRPIGFDLSPQAPNNTPTSSAATKFHEAMSGLSNDNLTPTVRSSPPPNYDTIIGAHASGYTPSVADFPEVPQTMPSFNLGKNPGGFKDDNDEDIDFADLAKRFEALKNKK